MVYLSTVDGWFRQSLAPAGDTRAFVDAAVKMLEAQYQGNAAFVLIEEGAVVGEHSVSIGEPVDGDSIFQVASLSKWVSAWGVMALVDAGKLDLDEPVSSYLTRWSLPESDFENSGVTVRRLLSHTAGLTDGLGYGGFASSEEVQPIEASLTQAVDASPGADGRVRVGIAPGTEFRYSGGGYTLLQLIVEEVSGERFEDYMHRVVFQPLEMDGSFYVVDEERRQELVPHYDVDGSEAVLFQFAGLAPTALHTTAYDLVRLVQAHIATDGLPAGRGVLQPQTLKLMRKPEAAQLGLPIWGLGTMLFAPNGQDGYIIGHDGSNEPAINSAARLDPDTGNGIVVLETGNRLLATRLAGEWVFWQTGTIDILMFTQVASKMIRTIVVGWGVIALCTFVVIWRRWVRRSNPQPLAD